MKKFYISVIGCNRRRLDAEKLKNYLVANRLNLVHSPKKADYLFIFTCGLTKLDEDKSINKISNLKKFKGDKFVCGCVPSMNMKRVKSIFSGKIINTTDLDKIDELFSDFVVKFKDVPDANNVFVENNMQKIKQVVEKLEIFYLFKFLNTVATSFYKFRRRMDVFLPFNSLRIRRSHFLRLIGFNDNFLSLRISTGCLGNCSYCNIKKAIGRLKSKPLPLILEELRRGLLDKQCKVNIISSDTGSYGLDIGSNFPQLLKGILAKDQRVTIEFVQDLHPIWICRYKSDLIELAKTKRIKSILTAIQSGSKRILKLMNRDVDLDEFKDVIKKMKKAYPGLRLGTQIIVGFPTETEKDFQDTLNFVEECQFDEVDIFRYYEVDTTDSAIINPKVPQEVIEERIKRINLPDNKTIHIC